MRFGYLALFAIAMLGLAAAQDAFAYKADSIIVSRQLGFEPMTRTTYRTDASVGTPVGTDLTVITLKVENAGQFARNSVLLTEDVSWIPTTKQAYFFPQPDGLDGRVAQWQIGTLAPGEGASVQYKVDGRLSPEVLAKIAQPTLEYAKNSAYLDAPSGSVQGKAITLALKDENGIGIAGAEIGVAGPTGVAAAVRTDSSGKAKFTPTDAGFYTYSAADFEIEHSPTTNVQEAEVNALTAGAMTPAKKQDAQDLIAAIAGVSPIIVGVLLLGIVAFALYAYLTTSEGREEEPLPPAPATRPSLSDEAPEQKSPLQFSVSYGAQEEQKRQEEIREQTRGLLEKRKAAMQGGETMAEKEDGGMEKAGEGEIGEVKEEAEGERGEETQEDERSEEKEGKQEFRQIEPIPSVAKEPEGRQGPEWMSAENYGGETAYADDETIRKTIEELEALRQQLRGKSKDEKALEGEAAEEEAQPQARKPRAPRIYPKKQAAKRGRPAGKKQAAKKKGRR